MDNYTFILRVFFSILFCFAGIMHLIKPKIFNNFIPNFLPKTAVNYVFGTLEFVFGVALLISNLHKNASLGILILLVIFLPIHIWDATKIRPAIGKKWIANIRIPIQFLLIYLVYIIYISS